MPSRKAVYVVRLALFSAAAYVLYRLLQRQHAAEREVDRLAHEHDAAARPFGSGGDDGREPYDPAVTPSAG